MIAFKVSLNDKRVCIAGAEDLGVLSTIVTAVGKLGKKTIQPRPGERTEMGCSVGGLTSRGGQKQDYHLIWKSKRRLKIGDVIQVEVLETNKADRPTQRMKSDDKTQRTKTVNRKGK